MADDQVPLDDAEVLIIDFGLSLEVSTEIKKHVRKLSAASAAASAASAASGSAPPSPASDGGGSDCDAGLDGWFLGSPAYASRRMLVCEPASYRDGARPDERALLARRSAP